MTTPQSTSYLSRCTTTCQFLVTTLAVCFLLSAVGCDAVKKITEGDTKEDETVAQNNSTTTTPTSNANGTTNTNANQTTNNNTTTQTNQTNQTPPTPQTPEQVIAEFKKIPPHEIRDHHLMEFVKKLEAANGIDKVTELDVSSGAIGQTGAEAISKLTSLKMLKMDSLRQSSFDLNLLSKLVNLELLSMYKYPTMNDAGMAAISKLTNLKELNLANTSINDAQFVHLNPLVKLEALYLGSTGINGSGFSALKLNRPLRILHVNNTSFGQNGPQFIAPYINSLEELNIGQASINDAHLRGINKFSKLKHLNVSFNQLKDIGLANVRGMKSLEILDIRSTKYPSDQLFTVLLTLPNIKIIIASGTGMTGQAAQLFVSKKKGCRVHTEQGIFPPPN